jgi:hypothetical protein
LHAASDINEAGQIIGFGTLNGAERSFLLTPFVAPAIPEPASWALMIAGFGIAGIMARRRVACVAA